LRLRIIGPLIAQVDPGAPEVYPLADFGPICIVICENDAPLLIPVNDHRETPQVAERQY
jgi:hypothetical protein